MVKRVPKSSCCIVPGKGLGCCRVESLVSIDERGQMVLPKELRRKAGIKPGDRLAVVSWETNGQLVCISLVKSDTFMDIVKDTLGPMVQEMFKKK